MPAPSPSTKPSRSLSHGREACSGASLRVLMAFIAQKPPSAVGDEPRSAPPTTITSASPDRKSTRLNSSHSQISYAVFCLKKKTNVTREYAYRNQPAQNDTDPVHTND